MAKQDRSKCMKSLSDHISSKHDGNNSQFARAIDVKRNQIHQWLNAKKPVFVVDGKLVQVIRDLKGN
jgi:hypothetical protein